MNTLLAALARVPGELLGVGLLPPAVVLRNARFQPDSPGSWCLRCGSSTCCAGGSGRTAQACGSGANPPRIALQVVRLGAHDGALRDWVIALKHQQWEAMGHTLGELLGMQVRRCRPELTRERAVVVPVPMPWIRRMERGIDHSAVLAAGAASALQMRCVQPLRQRAGGTQLAHAAREERLHRDGRFAARAAWRSWRARACVRGRTVILVDDVRTTGATLASAASALAHLGAAEVVGVVVTVKE